MTNDEVCELLAYRCSRLAWFSEHCRESTRAWLEWDYGHS